MLKPTTNNLLKLELGSFSYFSAFLSFLPSPPFYPPCFPASVIPSHFSHPKSPTTRFLPFLSCLFSTPCSIPLVLEIYFQNPTKIPYSTPVKFGENFLQKVY